MKIKVTSYAPGIGRKASRTNYGEMELVKGANKGELCLNLVDSSCAGSDANCHNKFTREGQAGGWAKQIPEKIPLWNLSLEEALEYLDLTIDNVTMSKQEETMFRFKTKKDRIKNIFRSKINMLKKRILENPANWPDFEVKNRIEQLDERMEMGDAKYLMGIFNYHAGELACEIIYHDVVNYKRKWVKKVKWHINPRKFILDQI